MNAPTIPAIPAKMPVYFKPIAQRLFKWISSESTSDPIAACEQIIAGWEPIKGDKSALMAYGAEVLAALKAA